jgi:hypothetical protein
MILKECFRCGNYVRKTDNGLCEACLRQGKNYCICGQELTGTHPLSLCDECGRQRGVRQLAKEKETIIRKGGGVGLMHTITEEDIRGGMYAIDGSEAIDLSAIKLQIEELEDMVGEYEQEIARLQNQVEAYQASCRAVVILSKDIKRRHDIRE